MKRIILVANVMFATTISLPAAAIDGFTTNIRLTCNVAGLYADGARIQGSGSEEISIDIRRIATNNAGSDIRVSSNGRSYEAALLKSASDRVAFAFANDALVDGVSQTLALTYEIRLDRLRLKRTSMTLFGSQGSATQSAEGNCVRTGGSPTPPAAVAPATAPAVAAPAPGWLVELRRKLKECRSKDPVSEVSCVERMQERFCANRLPNPPECSEK